MLTENREQDPVRLPGVQQAGIAGEHRLDVLGVREHHPRPLVGDAQPERLAETLAALRHHPLRTPEPDRGLQHPRHPRAGRESGLGHLGRGETSAPSAYRRRAMGNNGLLMATEKHITVLGAGGTMGLPMARNLARAGFAVHAWNRTGEKASPLEEDGVRVLESPGQATDGADVLLTMLSDADAVIDAVRDALANVRDGAVWLQMSTIGEFGTERCAELAAAHGVTCIDAPVLGTRQPAEQGKLVILASGPDDGRGARAAVQAVFDAVGQKTMWFGEAGEGTRLKLVVNSWVLTVVEGGAETIALAEGLGLDPALLFEAIEGGALDLPYLRLKGKAIAERELRAVIPAHVRGQGRAPDRGVGAASRNRRAVVQHDPPPAGSRRQGPWRRGHERDLLDERARFGRRRRILIGSGTVGRAVRLEQLLGRLDDSHEVGDARQVEQPLYLFPAGQREPAAGLPRHAAGL